MNRVTKGILMAVAGIVVVLLGGWVAVGVASVSGVESPAYEITKKAAGYEIRTYGPIIIAETVVEAPYRESINQGFGRVANYIFGNNTADASIAMTTPVLHEPVSAEPEPADTEPAESRSQKIAMTTPVLHEPAPDGGYALAFVMPSEYTLDTLPKPNRDNVQLREVPSRTVAVLKFRGYAPERTAERKTRTLLERLERDGVEVIGAPFVAQYDPPWTPPFMRRNEIQVEVAGRDQNE